MGLTQLDFEGHNKIEVAQWLLKAYEPPEGYYLADSGGVDSGVVVHLAQTTPVKHDAHYCVSPIDPPQVHQFLKKSRPDTQWDYHARGFWKMVHKKGLPRRQSRWCCEVIKEAGGIGRVVTTGSRRNEGSNRSKRKCVEEYKGKVIIRPINDWSRNEVWEYVHKYNIDYCSLYDEGFERLGCVLCPLATDKNRQRELERFPKIAANWRRACDRIVERRLAQGKGSFKTGQELWDWWIRRD